MTKQSGTGGVTPASYVVGIDLGTTHSVVGASPASRSEVDLFEVPQLVAPGELAARKLLPSFLYLPAPGELAESDCVLPWGPAEHIVGELARRLGARVPKRLVASAKSWLCHGGVDCRAPILPWGAADDEPQVSPVDAQARYLAHVRGAWDAAHADAPLADQDVVLTVPASFDSVARELTVDAAQRAGLPSVRLLEEPQAAFYDFLGAHEANLSGVLGAAKLVLVVDVGGGTTDLSLMRVHPPDGDSAQPQLERIAVGGHLMLGGDNMDHALAHFVVGAAGLTGQLDATEWSALVQTARHAKERLLEPDAPETISVAIQRRGSRLVAGTRTVTVNRDEARRLLVDGFLPRSGPADVTSRQGRVGLTTLGLPYALDPAIPHHICAFLRRHVDAAVEAGARVQEGLPRPDLLLLNGGVFNAPAMARRMSEVLAQWYDGEPVPLLDHTSLDWAVARGAVRHGLVRRGFGRAISGGSGRAYYVRVDRAEGQPGALCVAPRGMEDGATAEVRDRVFRLMLGRPVAFQIFSHSGDRADAAGTVMEIDDEHEPLPPLETLLRTQGHSTSGDADRGVPVSLSATLTESGTLELFLTTVELPPRRWRLQFALGSQTLQRTRPVAAAVEDLPERFGEARRLVEQVFNPQGKPRRGGKEDPAEGKRLRGDLERILGPRGQWSSVVCRELWGVLIAHETHRGRTSIHEQTWLRLAGWCLRPGFGAAGDDWRIEEIWKLIESGLQHPADKTNWVEWWILWRRVAGGLDSARQEVLFDAVRPWITTQPKGPPPKGPRAHGHAEMMRLLAALERLPADKKQEAGVWLIERFKKVGSWWPLGRLGARQPFRGRPQDVVPRAVAEAWLHRVLDLDWARADGAAFAAVLLARMTGDPVRDVDADLRQVIIERLRAFEAPETWIAMVAVCTSLSAKDAKRVFGDTLPVGLRLS